MKTRDISIRSSRNNVVFLSLYLLIVIKELKLNKMIRNAWMNKFFRKDPTMPSSLITTSPIALGELYISLIIIEVKSLLSKII